jgi:pyruvate/2-oxoglutarate dehydrogenase complex dihydrolipoamide acyltransferase (E2) component
MRSAFAHWRHGLWSLACLLMLAPDSGASAAGRLALVIGEAAYNTLPGEPACIVSAQTIAARLRTLGFDVIARNDASNGETSAMLIDLAHRAASAVRPTLVIYFCGHAVEFDGRVFLLPVNAVLDHPSDALAEGIPAQSLLDIAGRGTRVGLTVLDVYAQRHAQSNAPAALPTSLTGRTPPSGHIVVAANETAAAATATPLAQSLSAALAKPPVDLDNVLAVIRKDLADSGVAFAASGSGNGMTLIAAAAPSAAPPQPATSQPTAASTSPPPPAIPAAEPAAPAVGLPTEQQYSVLDRRRVQAALRLLGYYKNAVDGVFGPQTRAAIRRYQHDAGVPETGTLTPDEANRLVAGLPLTSR